LMNTAIATGNEKTLRDLYMISDRVRGPEGHILAYDNAYKIGQAIVANGNDYYLRGKAAGLTAAKIIKADYDSKEIALTNKQLDVVENIIKDLEALPDDTDKFVEYATKKYKDAIPNFNLKNYGL
ncbi:MAG: methanol--corrinoid methyltransferase, partial [Candidatus Methanomethylophilaceae archaeon]|nr:methanol--corrinoid methyltransferase [Candidatus Methanomethylophilaceae archaeon]